ncbi:ROK family protein [Ancylomarina longa]|uniref:ROK family protein n=1 Tax=Ancylomarina longa TaxID=2487017 RepID=A0A434AXE7_9BACT|nr:ROK family protein [Ancylomarina longa]RUT79202.1 ROK family protein [Ancylomarina longa]
MLNRSILGVDIGGTNIKAGLISNDQIIRKCTNPTGAMRSKEEILQTLFDTIDAVLTPEVQDIGIGVPGLLNLEKGQLLNIINLPAWKNLPLRDIVQDKYNRNVYLNNDANCFALGEKYFGKGKKVHNMLAITLGTGLGGGIISNNQLVTGLYGGAGEIGSIPYLDENLEAYCSSKFFIDKHQITGKELFLLAEQNQEHALQIFKEFGTHLGKMIHEVLFMLAPEMIVFGGSISKAFCFFQDALQNELNQFPFELIRDNVQIEQSDLEDAALFGAAAQYYNSILTQNIAEEQ